MSRAMSSSASLLQAPLVGSAYSSADRQKKLQKESDALRQKISTLSSHQKKIQKELDALRHVETIDVRVALPVDHRHRQTIIETELDALASGPDTAAAAAAAIKLLQGYRAAWLQRKVIEKLQIGPFGDCLTDSSGTCYTALRR